MRASATANIQLAAFILQNLGVPKHEPLKGHVESTPY